MGIIQRAIDWMLALGAGGGKRPSYRTHTEDGREILIEASEQIIGNNEAMAFFTDLCGGPLKEVMLRQGVTNIPMANGADMDAPDAGSPARGPGRGLSAFREYGIRVSDPGSIPVFARPGTYPHVELGSGNVAEAPMDGRPLVISSDDTVRSRASHATVVFSVFDVRRRSRQRQVTVHFHGRGVIRAKGFARDVGAMGRPMHYDGEEVKDLLRQKARHWSRKIHWCTPTERY